VKGVGSGMGAGMNSERLRRGPEFRRGNQEGLIT